MFGVFFLRKIHLERPRKSLNNVPTDTLTLLDISSAKFLLFSSAKVHVLVLYSIIIPEN